MRRLFDHKMWLLQFSATARPRCSSCFSWHVISWPIERGDRKEFALLQSVRFVRSGLLIPICRSRSVVSSLSRRLLVQPAPSVSSPSNGNSASGTRRERLRTTQPSSGCSVTGAQIIREARLRAGLTQSGLAERLGCGRAQVARWETGRQQATFENLRAAVQSCGFALKVEIERQEEPSAFDSELEASRTYVPQQRVRALLEGSARGEPRAPEEFDPYAMFDALERHEVGYVVIGALARVIHGSGESTCGLDIAPSLLSKNLHGLVAALSELGTDLGVTQGSDQSPVDGVLEI